MSELVIDAGRVGELAARFEQGPAVLERAFKVAMDASVLAIETSAKEVVPKDTGELRTSITTTATPFEGTVGTNKPYAPVMEYGRRPGGPMPPQGVLLDWMRRHGIDASAEYVIRRAIARKGIVGKRYMEQAFQKNEARVRQNFEEAGKYVAERLAGGR